MKIKWKHDRALQRGDKLPRKIKKIFLGKKVSGSKLRRMIAGYIIGDDWFCPECGCMHFRYRNHGVEYPEVWIDTLCARCRYTLATADNSEMTYVLDEPDYR